MIRIMILLMMLFVNSLFAQDFQGVAIYQSSSKMDLDIGESAAPSGMKEQLEAMLIKQFQKEYRLDFSIHESIYQEEKQLENPASNQGVKMIVIGSGGGEVLYKNTKESRYVSSNDIFGKQFLIKDTLRKNKWELTNETKKIGNYLCYKATRKVESIEIRNITINGEKEKAKEKKKEQLITAWYTPLIPVSNGPSMYGGLPGLILEVNDGKQTMLCKKIVINPKNKVTIKEPAKGKVVTQERFNEIMNKKIEEMKIHSSHRSGDGGIEIKIGG
ncbi:GLPGLI family protein [Aquimarina hainanensis]|uniref:GLPGLI family protein n=1 Tax=Aquimarina hainanensis TaxID=1578017 RepID=A0ABW5N9G2_9FLAO|nr:GLPGLI family protein [Aquimarina sp. TRL1]QKX05271.1 GLPGLI family protein [Aquimarina sp. TRL1]